MKADDTNEELYDKLVAKKVSRADLFDRIVKVILVIAFVTFSGIQVYNTFLIRDTQVNGTPTGRAILETNGQIKSCLETTGDCYKRSQANQASILNVISDRTVYAIKCAQDMPNAPVREVLACVDRFIAQETK